MSLSYSVTDIIASRDASASKNDLEEYKEHLTTLHPNLTFETRSGKEGEYLDLYLMIKNGTIEWRTFFKTPPVYVWSTELP